MKTCKKCNQQKEDCEFRPQRHTCRECERKYTRSYYAANYDHCIDYARKRHTERRAIEREYQGEYRKLNRDKVLRYNRQYDREHRDARREYMGAFREAHRDLMRLYESKRRAKLNGGELTEAEWLEVVGQYGGACLRCGSQSNITIDHIIPISRGGTHTKDNVQPLCKKCNSSKHDNTIDFRKHWKQWETNAAQIPIQ